MTVLSPDELLEHPTTVGRPAPGVEVEIRDELSQPVTPGHPGTIYIKNALTEGQFKASDDIGQLDENGYLTVLGRSIEKIMTRGFPVFPRLIENQIRELEGIQDCHVVGIPDEELGERVVAAVVLSQGTRLIERDILNYTSDKVRPELRNLAPNRVVFLRSLPRAPFKVQNTILREVVTRALNRIDLGLETP